MIETTKILQIKNIETPLGPVMAVADEEGLYLLDFSEHPRWDREVQNLQKKIKCQVISGNNATLVSIEQELKFYFAGKLIQFHTPVHMLGSTFQKQVWQELKKIPHGTTRSYLDVAKKIGRPTACRAVARANGSNPISIVVPCHRVINTSGELGGYAGGMARKQWLLEHEKNFE